MEEVDDDDQPQQITQVQVQHHNQNINIQNQQLIHIPKPLTTTTTTNTSYYPPPQENLDFPTIYSAGHFFNSITHNNQHHHNQQPYHEAPVGTTTITSTYLAVAPEVLFKSCSTDHIKEADAFNYMSNNCSSSSRWPREETMSLLQIRSRLHSRFKQATHKGPLWDEASRIMYEEHGYQRSGKKCREKFENLYKYYKKTKEAKAGKHDGKNYRFFRQLEALYGDQGEVEYNATQPSTMSTQFPPNSNDQVMMVRSSSHPEVSPNNNKVHNNMLMNKLACTDHSCLSLSNDHKYSSSHLFTSSSSSEDNNNKRSSSSGQDHTKKKKNKLKMKIKEFMNTEMKNVFEQQQLCMKKVMETIEQKEKERILREEKWRQEAEERLEKEHKLWANERAWMKARNSALMDTLQRLTSANRSLPSSSSATMQQVPSNARDPLALYNSQESQDRWFMASNHYPNHSHHHHHHDEINGFRVMMSDGSGNVGYGGSLLWDGSSFGLKLNNGDDENHQN